MNQNQSNTNAKYIDHLYLDNTTNKLCLVSKNSEIWIIDTGATNDMISKKDSIVKLDYPREVCA